MREEIGATQDKDLLAAVRDWEHRRHAEAVRRAAYQEADEAHAAAIEAAAAALRTLQAMLPSRLNGKWVRLGQVDFAIVKSAEAYYLVTCDKDGTVMLSPMDVVEVE